MRLIDVKNLLKDYGLPDLETLEYVLQQYQILINELSHNKFSKLTTAAKYIIDKVDAESVRHGRWIECDYKRLEHGMIETYSKAGYACSVCKTGFDKKKMTYKQYCPRCGARMDGGVNDESTT